MNEFWSRMSRDLEEMQRALRPFAHTPDELLPTAFRAHEEWCRDEVDRACLLWVRSGAWPDMTPEMMWWVCLRLGRALMTSAPLHLAFWQEHPSRTEALKWLLVDAWPLHVDALAAAVLLPPDEPEPGPPPEWLR